MTVPPDKGREESVQPGPQGGGPAEPQQPLDFDPYRFGAPAHPIAPEYAPPGYRPPPGVAGPQYPYTPSPGPPPGYPAFGVTRTANTKATLALVFGILALVFCWLSLLDLLFIVPAIVLGAVARGDAARYPERGGRGAATSGLICGILAVVLAVAATVYLYQRIKPCLDKYSPSSKAYQTCATDKIVGN